MQIEVSIKLVDQFIQLLYIGATASVLLAKFKPGLQDFLKYGKTLTDEEHIYTDLSLLDNLLKLQVPKFWFFHFYLISFLLCSTGFFLVLMSYDISKSHEVLDHFRKDDYGQIPIQISRLAFFLMIGHSSRRLAETLLMMRYRKNSKMNISHYLVGIFFYSTVNVQLLLNTDFRTDDIPTEEIFEFSNLIYLILFYLASFSQFLHHLHLSKVVKYKIPRFGMFQYLCCAHYFDEILIYTSLFLLTQNLTSFLCLLFVIVNLSVSSLETKKFYKTNENGKVPRWSIIPFIL